MAEIDFNAVIRKYLSVREERTELKRTFERADEILVDQQNKIEAWIFAKQKAMGITQLKGDAGIAFQQTRKNFTCQDWGLLHEWIRANNRLDLLEKRPAQRALAELLEETGTIPPGMGLISKTEIIVRKG